MSQDGTPSNSTSGAKGRLLLTAAEAAEVCSKSLRTWRTWDSAGLIPAPRRIGRSTLWSRRELEDWVEAGCPLRQEWDAMKQNGKLANSS